MVGYCVGIADEAPQGVDAKELIRIIDEDGPTFRPSMMSFVSFLADYYMAPIGEVMRSAHPSGTNSKSVPALSAGPNVEGARFAAALDLDLGALLIELDEKKAPVALAALPGAPNQRVVKSWLKSGFVVRDALIIEGRVAIKTQRAYKSLRMAPSQPRGRGGAHLKRDLIHTWLDAKEQCTKKEIEGQFPGCGQHLRALVKEGAITALEQEVLRDPFMGDTVRRDRPPALNQRQKAAVDEIISANTYQGFLLNGVTGSGKTEVYLHAIEHALSLSRGALVLVPEIALTPQLVRRFRARFGTGIAVLHSGLSAGERYDQWRQIQRGELNIVIGARSALFAPIAALGIIVVDEEHDPSYKQGDGLRYHARDMALLRGKLEEIPVILGSATPSLESVHNVRLGKLKQLNLPTRATGGHLPQIELVDLSVESAPNDGIRYLSEPVRLALADTLASGDQSIVFLNRRGFSSFVQCTTCGHVEECHRCAITMTWHKRRGLLSCHYCNAARPVPQVCSECHQPSIQAQGRGTEQVEERLASLFPKARIARLDRDTSSHQGLQKIVDDMRDRKIDILVGTQMVTKGHDFPHVTLVCVLDADAGLSFPDFRASERTLQLLTQVSGRAGRHAKPGRVLVQTWDASQTALSNLKGHDYGTFCDEELEMRRLMGYPPLRFAATIRVDARASSDAEKTIRSLADALSRVGGGQTGFVVRGPAPAALERLKGRSRWALLITAQSRAALRNALKGVDVCGVQRRGDIRILVDIDPHDML